MKRALLALLLLCATPAYAALSFVAGSSCIDFTSAGGDATCTPSVPTGTTDGDKLVAFAMSPTSDAGTPNIAPPAGWTCLDEVTNTSGADRTATICHKTAASESAEAWATNGTSNNYIGVVILAFRGAATALDVTYVQATHHSAAQDTLNPNPSDITTTTDNAFVVTCMGGSHNEITGWGAPSGFTLASSTTTGSNHRNAACSYIDAGTAGAETVGVWTNTGSVTNTDTMAFTIALAAASSGCAGGRNGVVITGTSNNTDPDNILYGQSPAVVAAQDTVCYDPTSDILSDTVSVSPLGWVTFSSGGSILTDDFDYCILDNGAACGTDGTFQVTQTPTLSSYTGTATGTTTADLAVTVAQVEGTVYTCVQASSVATPSHAQIAAGNNGAGAACTFAANDATPSASQTFSATGLTAGTSYEACFGQANAATTPLTATVVCSDVFITTASGDTTPTAFSFTDSTAQPSTPTYSSEVTIAGIDAAANVSISGDNCQWQKNTGSGYGALTSDIGTILVTNTLRVYTIASAEEADEVSCIITVGGVSATWRIFTPSEAGLNADDMDAEEMDAGGMTGRTMYQRLYQ